MGLGGFFGDSKLPKGGAGLGGAEGWKERWPQDGATSSVVSPALQLCILQPSRIAPEVSTALAGGGGHCPGLGAVPGAS